jgi:hypothetical protein
MPLVVKESDSKFEPAPPGLHRAVCCDIVDLGLVDTQFGSKHKIRVVWQTQSKNKQGERYQVRQDYTASLAEGANLRRDLQSWRGKPFTPEELKAFDVEKLIGVNCQLSLTHETSKKGRTFARVTAVVPPDRSQPPMLVENYTREPWADEKPVTAEPIVEAGPAEEFVDNDVPF